MGEEAAWVQMNPHELAFEALDQFLGLAPWRRPYSYLLVDLTSISGSTTKEFRNLAVEIRTIGVTCVSPLHEA